MTRHCKFVVFGLTAVLIVLLPTLALGHAYLESAAPGRDATVTEGPLREVRLRYSEPVELAFSTFKVYPLETDSDDPLQVRGQASELVSRVLTQRRDEAARADDGVITTGRISAEVLLRMKPDLAPGAYVVMWRVLSIDTHTTEGFYVFHYEPEA